MESLADRSRPREGRAPGDRRHRLGSSAAADLRAIASAASFARFFCSMVSAFSRRLDLRGRWPPGLGGRNWQRESRSITRPVPGMGTSGSLPPSFLISTSTLRTAVAYLCGPESMMRFALRDLLKRKMQRERMFVSLERNMQCAVGFCGHCQFGPSFVCMDGPGISIRPHRTVFRDSRGVRITTMSSTPSQTSPRRFQVCFVRRLPIEFALLRRRAAGGRQRCRDRLFSGGDEAASRRGV